MGNNYLTILWWFLPYINMNQSQVCMYPTLTFSSWVKSLFFTSVSFAALHVESLVPYFSIPYICFHIQYLSFPFWLTSHTYFTQLVSSTSLELTQMCSFSWLSNILLCICTTIYYPLVNWWTFCCFHVLVVVNSVATNMGDHISLPILVS